MRVTAIQHLSLVTGCLFLAVAACAAERGLSESESSAWAMAHPLEKEGFSFRAEAWERELKPDVGKAVRVQLFKGNDYRFCIAVPADSGVQITATVLDLEGKPQGQLQSVEAGWGLVLSFKPRKTGVYAVAIRQTDKGRMKAVNCAMITGYQ